MRATGTYAERFEAILAGHERMKREWRRINAIEGPPPEDQSVLSAGWQGWFDAFTAIKDEMYRLAYDLGIDWGPAEATADDYQATWQQVQLLMAESGSRRVGRR